MIKFLKLTECNGQPVLINIERIEHSTVGAKGNDTYIKLLKNSEGKENYFFVKESVEDIWNMLKAQKL